MWTWDQSAGVLSRDGAEVAKGYSGRDWGKNNPDAEAARGIGPIPAGDYTIVELYNSANVGPNALRLQPIDATPDDVHDATGRSAFRIHGDSIRAPGTASHGCIILRLPIRLAIWESGDRLLRVVE